MPAAACEAVRVRGVVTLAWLRAAGRAGDSGGGLKSPGSDAPWLLRRAASPRAGRALRLAVTMPLWPRAAAAAESCSHPGPVQSMTPEPRRRSWPHPLALSRFLVALRPGMRDAFTKSG